MLENPIRQTPATATGDAIKNGVDPPEVDPLMTEENLRELATKHWHFKNLSLWKICDVLKIAKALVLSEWTEWNDKYAITGGDIAKEQSNNVYTNIGLLAALVFTVAVSFAMMIDPTQDSLLSGDSSVGYAYLTICGSIALGCAMLISVFYSLVLNELGDDDMLQWKKMMGSLETVPISAFIVGLVIMFAIVVLFSYDCMKDDIGNWVGVWVCNVFLIFVPFLMYPGIRSVQELNTVSETNKLLGDGNEDKNFTFDELMNKLTHYAEMKKGYDFGDKKEFLEWLTFDDKNSASKTSMEKPKKWKLTESTIIRAKKLYKHKLGPFVELPPSI